MTLSEFYSSAENEIKSFTDKDYMLIVKAQISNGNGYNYEVIYAIGEILKRTAVAVSGKSPDEVIEKMKQHFHISKCPPLTDIEITKS